MILKTITFAPRSAWTNLNIARVYGISLSDNHGFYLAYKTVDGATMRVFECPKLDRRCPRFGKTSRDLWYSDQTALSNLKIWVSSHLNTASELQNAYVVFGPQYSYVAKSANDIIWHNLPSDLEILIQSKRSRDPSCLPTQVTLGWRGAWAAIWPDGTNDMNLVGHYPALAENMKNSNQPLSFITLNAFQPNYFISYFGKIELRHRGPASLLEMLHVYEQQRINRANISAEMKETTETTVKTWRIEPKTTGPSTSGTLTQIQTEGGGQNATTETKKTSTETKVLVGAVVLGLAAGCVVIAGVQSSLTSDFNPSLGFKLVLCRDDPRNTATSLLYFSPHRGLNAVRLTVEILQEIGFQVRVEVYRSRVESLTRLQIPTAEKKTLRCVCEELALAMDCLIFTTIILNTLGLHPVDGTGIIETLVTDALWTDWSRFPTALKIDLFKHRHQKEYDPPNDRLEELLYLALSSMPNIRTLIEEIEIHIETRIDMDCSWEQVSGIRKLTINSRYIPPTLFAQLTHLVTDNHGLEALHLLAPADWSQFWVTLRVQKMHLIDVATNNVTDEFLCYLGSYSGLQRLALQYPSANTQTESDQLADRFFDGRWSFGAHNADVISSLHRLSRLEMSVNGHDVSHEHSESYSGWNAAHNHRVSEGLIATLRGSAARSSSPSVVVAGVRRRCEDYPAPTLVHVKQQTMRELSAAILHHGRANHFSMSKPKFGVPTPKGMHLSIRN
ncbi:hypothetical protein DFH09DRAFT_1096790 [Mycena vulgaris]|nr:hypothetical protein DFH09DRAFT_1096790 [Mycena vulgaris]